MLHDFIFNQVFNGQKWTKARVRVVQSRFLAISHAVPAHHRVLARYIENTFEDVSRNKISVNAMVKRLGYVKATLEGIA